MGNIQDFYNPRASRSLTSFDVAHRVVVSYVADLPFGHGQKWLGTVTGLTGQTDVRLARERHHDIPGRISAAADRAGDHAADDIRCRNHAART